MSLEVGNSAWTIASNPGGLGVVSTSLTESVRVRLTGVSDCHVYAEFEAEPGSMHVVRFGGLGEPDAVSVEEVDDIEAGPSLPERATGPTDCE